MSTFDLPEPACSTPAAASPIELVIEGRRRGIDGMAVQRVLPVAQRRALGPWVFLDQMGPVQLPPGGGLDVRPHPHINLATVTYLFEGEIVHRDSLGSIQRITPGAINWMTAGRGIAHSERTPPEARAAGPKLHGLQLWVALPAAEEEREPSFHHHAAGSLPALEVDGVTLRVLAGEAYGARSPVRTFSPLFYVDAIVPRGRALPLPADFRERGAYLVEGAVGCAGERFEAGRMLVFRAGASASLHALDDARVVLLGGEPLEGPRHIWWNFVSSSRERIERAKADWREGRFGQVVGETEFIPLPTYS